jgi:hypothetical protein
MEDRFDVLAKSLAEGVSRRVVLRWIGGGLTGAVLASLGLGRAWGDPPPQSAGDVCQRYCNQQYPPGPNRTACIRNCCHHDHQCGSNAYCLKMPGDCSGPGFCQAKDTVLCCGCLDPVCGCDGVTYDNACFAFRVTSIAHTGVC